MVNAGLSITWKPAAFHLDFLRGPQPFRPAPLTALRSRHSQSSPACHGRMERCNQSQLKAAPQIQSRPDLVNVTSPLERFNHRKRPVTRKWHVDETYVKVRGRWMYLYRAIDNLGDTVEFFFSEHRDLLAAKRFIRKAFARHGRPERIVIDGSQTNHEAIIACDGESRLRNRSRRLLKPIRIRQSQYLNNRIEQDHRRIKRRIRSMLGFKSTGSAATILSGIEMVHMMRKRQARYAYNPAPSLAEQFEILAA